MRMKTTTSSYISQFFGEHRDLAFLQYQSLADNLRTSRPWLAASLDNVTLSRAALLIPHLFTELGYYAISGQTTNAHLQKYVMNFSFICLAIAFADDMVDSKDKDFAQRMTRGCIVVELMDYAYQDLLLSRSEEIPNITLNQIASLVQDVINTASAEIEYRKLDTFSLERYLEVTRKKTSLYTTHGLLLASKFLGKFQENQKLLVDIGESMGTAIQLIDDLLDVHEDLQQDRPSLTYPVFLTQQQQSIEPIHRLINKELMHSVELSQQLPYPEHLVKVALNINKIIAHGNG
jgi:hypothetical protein